MDYIADRSWMYKRIDNGRISTSFLNGLNAFINFAVGQDSTERDGVKMKCPCKQNKCRNRSYRSIDDVKFHLCTKGFVDNYFLWSHHGETEDLVSHRSDFEVGGSSSAVPEVSPNVYMNMVQDAAGPDFEMHINEADQESPNPEAQKFFDMLEAAKQSLYPGCEKHTQLSFIARLMNMKSEHGFSQKCYDQFIELTKEIVSEENNVADNFYESKKLLRGMGLPVEKIDCCKNNCMIYWRDDSELDICKFCKQPRFKPLKEQGNAKRRKSKPVPYKKMYYFPLTPRLQRLYASEATTKDMRWHAEHVVDDGVMRIREAFIQKEGREPSAYDLHLRLHKRDDGSFTDDVSEQIAAEYESTLQSRVASQESGTHVDPNDVYLSVVKPKKGPRFGTGSVTPLFDVGGSSSSSSQQAAADCRIEQLHRELQESRAVQQEAERRQQEAERRHQEELQRLREEQAQFEMRIEERLQAQFNAQIETAMARMAGRAPPPPPPDFDQ